MNMPRGWHSPGQSVEYTRCGPRCLLGSFAFVVDLVMITIVSSQVLTPSDWAR